MTGLLDCPGYLSNSTQDMIPAVSMLEQDREARMI